MDAHSGNRTLRSKRSGRQFQNGCLGLDILEASQLKIEKVSEWVVIFKSKIPTANVSEKHITALNLVRMYHDFRYNFRRIEIGLKN